MLSLPLPTLLLVVAIAVVSLTFHEYAHSLAAIRLGDDTPKRDGRLTLNPLVHIDLVGFLMLVVAGFGWAKPVRIDSRLFKKPRRDEIIVSMAGPAANLLLAVLAVAVLKVFLLFGYPHSEAILQKLVDAVSLTAIINIGLALFNLLPIPPLDGSHFITVFVAWKNQALAATIFRYGSLALLAVLVIQWIARIQILPIGSISEAVLGFLFSVFGVS